MIFLLLNVFLPIYLIGLFLYPFFGSMVGFIGEQFDMKVGYSSSLSAKGKIQATKFFASTLIWPLALPFFLLKMLNRLRVSYLGWVAEVNEDELKKVERSIDELESSLERSTRLSNRAISARKRYEEVLTKYGK